MIRLLQSLMVLLVALALAACGEVGGPLGGRDEGILYQETFDAAARDAWTLEGDADARAAILNDQLLIEVDAPDVVQYATLTAESFSDFTLQVDVAQLAGGSRSSYGVLFRLQEDGGFYRFAVSPRGYFMVELHQADGRRTRLTDGWVPTGNVNSGLNQINRLQITTAGSSLAFFINGVFQIEIAESSLGQGHLALDAGTFEDGGLRVAFDDLIVRERQ